MHSWITHDESAACQNCGLIVDEGPLDEGQYPLACGWEAVCPDNSPDAAGGAHHIVAAPSGGECCHCGEEW